MFWIKKEDDEIKIKIDKAIEDSEKVLKNGFGELIDHSISIIMLIFSR